MHQICDIWGRTTKEELRARSWLLTSISMSYWSRAPYGDATIRAAQAEFSAIVKPETDLSDAYSLLNREQRASLRAGIENPAVRVTNADGTELWIEANLDVLNRLEQGVRIGPIDEVRIDRPAGTKAF